MWLPFCEKAMYLCASRQLVFVTLMPSVLLWKLFLLYVFYALVPQQKAQWSGMSSHFFRCESSVLQFSMPVSVCFKQVDMWVKVKKHTSAFFSNVIAKGAASHCLRFGASHVGNFCCQVSAFAFWWGWNAIRDIFVIKRHAPLSQVHHTATFSGA